MKIVILDSYALDPGDLGLERLSRYGELESYDRTGSEAEAIRRIGDAQIVLTNKTPITARLLDECPGIRLICVMATGYNVVDCAAARVRGISVCNVPSYGTDAVAQFTIGLLLELCHRIGLHDSLVRQGEWAKCQDFCFWRTPQTELAGKTLGIIGPGKIGLAVGKIASALGMEVIAASRTPRSAPDAQVRFVTLEELLSSSHVISLHCPLTAATERVINAESIAKMRRGAFLINTARGALIDEQAVADALSSGQLGGAALDVVLKEPIVETNPLLHAPNCILTPHMAWAPLESRRRLLDCLEENIRAYLNGHPQNVVN